MMHRSIARREMRKRMFLGRIPIVWAPGSSHFTNGNCLSGDRWMQFPFAFTLFYQLKYKGGRKKNALDYGAGLHFMAEEQSQFRCDFVVYDEWTVEYNQSCPWHEFALYGNRQSIPVLIVNHRSTFGWIDIPQVQCCLRRSCFNTFMKPCYILLYY